MDISRLRCHTFDLSDQELRNELSIELLRICTVRPNNNTHLTRLSESEELRAELSYECANFVGGYRRRAFLFFGDD